MLERPTAVRPMVPADWLRVRAIYAAGIATGNATFETEPPEWEAWDSSHSKHLRYVATRDGQILGWAAATPVSERCCYSGVVENSVYIDPGHHGQGIGTLVLLALIEASRAAGNWTMQTGIFPENAASIALHESCGFRVVGYRERLGQLHGVWRDVLLMEHRIP